MTSKAAKLSDTYQESATPSDVSIRTPEEVTDAGIYKVMHYIIAWYESDFYLTDNNKKELHVRLDNKRLFQITGYSDIVRFGAVFSKQVGCNVQEYIEYIAGSYAERLMLAADRIIDSKLNNGFTPSELVKRICGIMGTATGTLNPLYREKYGMIFADYVTQRLMRKNPKPITPDTEPQ